MVYLCELDTYAAVTKLWPQFPDFLWPTQLICPPSQLPLCEMYMYMLVIVGMLQLFHQLHVICMGMSDLKLIECQLPVGVVTLLL